MEKEDDYGSDVVFKNSKDFSVGIGSLCLCLIPNFFSIDVKITLLVHTL